MTTHDVHSAYPVPVADLLPRARFLAAELGQVPSRNRLMTELRIGAPKAREVRSALQDGPAPSDDGHTAGPARLHAVPDMTEHPQPEAGAEAGDEPGEPDAEAGNGSGSESRPDPGPAPLPASETQAQPTPDADPDTAPTPDARDEWVSGEATRAVEDPVTPHGDPGPVPASPPASASRAGSRSRVRSWPVLLLAAPAFVAIWSGWVGLGSLTGFGVVHPLPGIWDSLQLNTAITLPIGMETYAAYALRVWVAGRVPARARRFAKHSAIGALALGALGQIAYHLMAAAGVDQAPWPITTAVSCLPVAVLGMGAALAHLLHTDTEDDPHDTDDVHEEAVR